MIYLVKAQPFIFDEKVLVPVFEVGAQKRPKEAICLLDDIEASMEFWNKEKRSDCLFYEKVCSEIADGKEWDNFYCSDKCPHKYSEESAEISVSHSGSGWGDLLLHK